MAQNGLLDFLQGASNSAASTVSAPVDGLAWLLRKAGAKVGDNPIGGSDWMRANGLTQEPQNKLMGLLGEAAGGVAPMVAGAYAPQIAKGLLGMMDNAAIPKKLNKQAGVLYHGGELVKNPNAIKQGIVIDGVPGVSFTPNIVEASRYARHNIGPINAIDDSSLKIYKGGDEVLDSAYKSGDFSSIKTAGFDGVKLTHSGEHVLFDPEKVLSLPRKVSEQNGNRQIGKDMRYFLDWQDAPNAMRGLLGK